MLLKEFIVKFTTKVGSADLDAFNKKLDTAKEKMGAAAVVGVGIGAALTAAVTVPLEQMAHAFIEAAANAEEVMGKFGVVFKSIGDEAEAAAQRVAKSYSLSNVEAHKLLSTTGNLLEAFGFNQKSSLNLSEGITSLSADLAAFNNIQGGAGAVSGDLTRFILSQRNAMLELGISLKDEQIQHQALINKANGLQFATAKNALAYAKYQLVVKATKNAHGAFDESIGNLSQRQLALKSATENLAVSYGKILLPPFLAVLKVLTKIVQWFTDLSTRTKTIIIIFAAMAAAIGPILLAAVALGGAIIGLNALMAAFGITTYAALLPIIGIVLAVVAGIVLLALVIEDVVAFFQGRDSITGLMVEGFKKAGAAIIDFFTGAFPNAIRAALLAVTAWIQPLADWINGIFSVAGKFIGGGAASISDTLRSGAAALGIGSPTAAGNIAATAIAPIPGSLPASGGTGLTQNNFDVKVDSPVTVPEGTPPGLVSDAVKGGISDAMTTALRNAHAATKNQVEY